jgi:C-8 sterol isomerase
MSPLHRIPPGDSGDQNLFLIPTSAPKAVSTLQSQFIISPKSSTPKVSTSSHHFGPRLLSAASLPPLKLAQTGNGAPTVTPAPQSTAGAFPHANPPHYEKELPPPMTQTDWILEGRPDLDKDDRARAKRINIRTQQVMKKHYKFEPIDLKAVADLGRKVLKETGSHEAMFRAMHEELLKRYPGNIVLQRSPPLFNYAGTAIGKMQTLHCLMKEYITFFWTAIGNEGPLRRYPKIDVWDFILDGKQLSEPEGGFESAKPREPGDIHYLPRGQATHYVTPGGAHYLEYGRSDNVMPSTMSFGVISPAISFSKDYQTMWRQMGRCVEFIVGRNR